MRTVDAKRAESGLRPMSGLLAVAFLIAGALMELMAVGNWNGREVEFIARAGQYGQQPLTMPLPTAGFGLVFLALGAMLLLPHRLVDICVALIVLGGLIGTVFFVWQPDWADPPRQRRNR
jgi:hypothetical protein